jgi:hypothetical protein
MPAKYVRPYSKGQKNDFDDAEAIAEAVQRPTMKFVATKTAETVRRPLPVFPDQRTSSDRPSMSGWCQSTKSLRSSPLRGSKSREAGSRSRGQGWRGGKVNTISSCIVGVQRMIKNSKDHLAGRHPDVASHIDPAVTQ